MAISAHPWYGDNFADWQKWRLTYEGGRPFIDRYLHQYHNRETPSDFRLRKSVTYCPAFAKRAINNIKNVIYAKTGNIIREGGSPSYHDARDINGHPLNYFMGHTVLKELLVVSRVGIFVDMPPLDGPTLLSVGDKHPYLYYYPVEDILNWSWQDDECCALELQDNRFITDNDGFVTGTERCYRRLYKQNGKVICEFYDDKKNQIEQRQLGIDRIPFVMPTLPHSLLKDVADYQIALLNLESSDINYILQSNFPFYTEQFDARAENVFAKGIEGNDPGQIEVGPAKGRRYPLNTERPQFIHPSSEPLTAAMSKEQQIKQDIDELVNFALIEAANVESIEAGLSYLALILNLAEQKIADYWAMYEGGTPAQIVYPDTFIAPVDEKKLDRLITVADLVAAPTAKKEIAKKIIRSTIGCDLSTVSLQTIYDEIDAGPITFGAYKAVNLDVTGGYLSLEHAAQARGYPVDTVVDAKEDHADRLARVQAAQSPGGLNAAARGIIDLSDGLNNGLTEKAQANDPTTKVVPEDQHRGDGR